MFDITQIKNAHRHRVADKKPAIAREELFEQWPEEAKPMPYFSVVAEQVQRDTRYQALNRGFKGEFWRLCVSIAGTGERGRFADFGPAMSKRMEMTSDEWESFRTALLANGLLALSPDGIYLIQPELREQCLQYARSK